ncbi:MAG: ABC transporter substrate-binding protein [Acidimicrobiales bacterium]
MRIRRHSIATFAAAVLLLSGWATASSAASHTTKGTDSHSIAHATSGGTVTFAEQPGAPPTYIFPLYNGANSGNNNITYLQPLMWLPLYWFGHSNNEQATVNYSLSMADPPVFSNGNKTITVTLKKYDWSNGTPVTSRDILFFMNLVLANKSDEGLYVPGGWMDHVGSMSAPNASTFVMNLTKAYNPTYMLYNGLSVITPIPQSQWDKTSATGAIGTYDNTTAGAQAVYKYLNSASMSLSTWDTDPLWQMVDGPFHLQPNTGFQVTGQVIMVPNAKFSGPNKPKISEFEELPFTSAAAEYNALQSGSVDYGYVPTTDIGDIGALKSSGYTIDPWYEWGISFIGITFTSPKYAPLLNQFYIRQAMQSMIDQPAYIKSLLLGYGEPTYGPVPVFPSNDFLAPAAKNDPDPYSPTTAKKLLTSHGWKIPSSGAATCKKPGTASGECGSGIAAGAKLSMPLEYVAQVPALDNEIQAMQSAFSSVGINLTLKEAPFDTVLTDAYDCQGKTTATCPSNTPPLTIISSPVWTYVPVYYPVGDTLFGCDGATNAGDYCNQSVQALINQITTGTTASAAAAFDKYQVLVADQLPDFWFPNAAYQISAISSKLGGVVSQDSTGHIYPQTWSLKS